MSKAGNKDVLIILDVFPLLYRAHFATLGTRLATTQGKDTRVTLVFFNYIFQLLREHNGGRFVAVSDSAPTGRSNIYTGYKENRETVPPEVLDAFPYAKRLLASLSIPLIEIEGFEADDIIASIAIRNTKKFNRVILVSPDKDLAQLVNKTIFLQRPAYKTSTFELLDEEGVTKKYGVPPKYIADYLALKGDPTDNIPGIKGIGEKTASSLINEFGGVREIIEKSAQIKKEKLRTSIEENKENLLLYYRLALLNTELEIELQEKETSQPETKELYRLLDELEFKQLKERLQKLYPEEKKAYAIARKAALHKTDAIRALMLIHDANTIAISVSDTEPKQFVFCCEEDGRTYSVSCDLLSDLKDILKKVFQRERTVLVFDFRQIFKYTIEFNIKVYISSCFDIKIAAYLLRPDDPDNWDHVSARYNLPVSTFNDPNVSNSDPVPTLHRAYQLLTEKLQESKLTKLFRSIEMPLSMVLAQVEKNGVMIDTVLLEDSGRKLKHQAAVLQKKIVELAGEVFNINSSQQVAGILARIASPQELRRTRGGKISTAEIHLKEISHKYPFVEALLSYRKITKLITTYIDSLPQFQKADGKIYPKFQQTVTGTGRLSCAEPNLQNLPVRSETGKEIRRAIVAESDDHEILAIDYNQIELRLIAALSKDELMIAAFEDNKDIHTTTASRIFAIPEKEVTKELRNKAKAVNFGIAYGMSAFGLADRLKISRAEAAYIIKAYFDEFPGIREYLRTSIQKTLKTGFSRTLMGRIRFIDGLDSANSATRKAAERMAINAPVQGLAADIIKCAMVRVQKYIRNKRLKSKMIMQVHDELVFQLHKREKDFFIQEVCKIMENVIDLSVPMKTDAYVGPNWLDMQKVNLIERG